MANAVARTGGSAFDFGKWLEEEIGYDLTGVEPEYEEIDFYGETIRVTKQMNTFNGLGFDPDDTASIVKTLLMFIHPEDRVAFKTKVASFPKVDPKAMVAIINGIITIAAEGKAPTSSGDSSRTTRKKAVGTRSEES